MMAFKTISVLTLVVIWNYVFGLQRPPPRYSQQYMPQTSFTCRNKIVGSYYADPETDCQLFHVCVSVAGTIQDYRFLCPNDTAFDQESQTCADWYDVDCEAATLYYASDNFDLYRIGSGLESLHYDSIRNDFEPQDHLQRSESNDLIRSPLNSYNSNNYKESEASKKNKVRSNDNNNQYASRNQKHPNTETESILQKNQEPEKKINLRKISRKSANNGFTNNYVTKSTTIVPVSTSNYYIEKSISQNYVHPTGLRPSTQSFTTLKSNQVISTLNPTTKFSITSAKSTANLQDTYTNYQTTTAKSSSQNNFNNFNRFETTAKPTTIATTHYTESQSYSVQFSQGTPSTTKQLILNNHGNDYKQKTYSNYDNNYSNKNNNDNHNNNNNINNYNYNNVHKTNTSSYILLTSSLNNFENYNNNNNNNYNSNAYVANTFVPTTYTPSTKKFVNNRQFYDKLTTKSTHYTEMDSTKVFKTNTHKKNYQNYETSTKNYDFRRSSIGLGFSPSSVNHLAENFRLTTPTPRLAASPTTYNPNNFNTHVPQNQVTQQKSTYYQNQSAKRYSTTMKFIDETTTRSKLTKKNDYDYAYYDNGPIEYDNIELEHVSNNKESVKII